MFRWHTELFQLFRTRQRRFQGWFLWRYERWRIAVCFSPAATRSGWRTLNSTHCALARRREAPVIALVKTMIVGRHLVEKGASFVASGRGGSVVSDVTNTGLPVKCHIYGHELETRNQSLKFILRKTKWLAVISLGPDNQSEKENTHIKIFFFSDHRTLKNCRSCPLKAWAT